MSRGTLDVVAGSMYAGKTEEAIRRARNAQSAGAKLSVYGPSIDQRYSDGSEIVSHDGGRFPANKLNHADPNVAHEFYRHALGYGVVIVDEGQFFPDQFADAVLALRAKGISLVVAGLDLDFRGEPFGIMPKLMTYADEVKKLHCICTVCGVAASMTQRLVNGQPAQYNAPIIMVGAKNDYEARCRECHEVPGAPDRFAAFKEEIVGGEAFLLPNHE